MNTLLQLSNLRDKVSYYEWLFDISDKSNAQKRYEMLKIARKTLKDFKAVYYPHLLQQPKNPFKPIPFTPMSEWTEKFEEYGDMY
jgi:hypothetical protein